MTPTEVTPIPNATSKTQEVVAASHHKRRSLEKLAVGTTFSFSEALLQVAICWLTSQSKRPIKCKTHVKPEEVYHFCSHKPLSFSLRETERHWKVISIDKSANEIRQHSPSLRGVSESFYGDIMP